MHNITAILKRDGRKQKYEREKIAVAIWKALQAVAKTSEVKRAVELSLTRLELDRRSLEWKEASRLSKIVENILVRSNGSRKWQVEEIQDVVERVLLAAGHEEAVKAYILYRNKRQATRDPTSPRLRGAGKQQAVSLSQKRLEMSDNAYRAMARRYLRKNAEDEVVETPLQAMKRVAQAVAHKKWRDEFLTIMTSFEFTPAGCYFRGAGNKKNRSLANCFVLPVEDSIEQIFEAVKWSALIHTRGGGSGFNFSRLRPKGDTVAHGGLAAGVVNFMKAFDAETSIISQGGLHRGANMGILNVDHPDIFEFIQAKSIDGEVSNFNLSVGVSHRFIHAVKKNRQWTLKNPRNHQIIQKIPARSLWKQIIQLAHQIGDPGIIFLDHINRTNPILKTLGPIEATNVCGEQPLYPFDVCNLGSINLAKFVIVPFWEQSEKLIANSEKRQRKTQNSRRKINITDYEKNIRWSRLEEVVRLAVRFLDSGIDASTYPIPQIENMAHQLRRIGLGVMGWADMLVQLGVQYDSDEGVKLAEKIMKFIQEVSWNESEKLAREKGVFPLWGDSYFNTVKNPFGKKRKVRNVAVTTIAPTGTISMIADCSSGIEPYFALEYTKNVVDRNGLRYTNKCYEKAKEKMATFEPFNPASPAGRHLAMLDEVFKTAHQISPDWHVKIQAAFQRHTDNAVSKTINFPKKATVKEIEKAYLLAWELGCKGITVYRDGSRSDQILSEEKPRTSNLAPCTSGKSRLAQSQLQITPLSQRAYQLDRRQIIESVSNNLCPECGGQMEMVEGCSLCRSCGYSKCSL